MPIGVNLLDWRRHQERRRRRWAWLAIGAAGGIGLGGMLLAAVIVAELSGERLEANRQLREEIATVARTRAAVQALEQRHERLGKRLAAMQALLAERSVAVTTLAGVTAALPERMRLTRLEQSAGRLVIEGLAPDSAAISAWLDALRATPGLGDLAFGRLATSAAPAQIGERFRIVLREARE